MTTQLTKRQKQTYEVIRKHIAVEGKSPTIRELALRLGLSSTGAAGNILRTLVRKKMIQRSRYQARGISLINPGSDRPVDFGIPVRVPLVGQVAAGLPILAAENIERHICLDRSWTKGRDAFCLRVKGESMVKAGIRDGDIVVVAKQDTANSGDIVVALLDDEATIKYFRPKKNEIHLEPANDGMYAIVVRDKNFRIQGRVIGVYRGLVN